MQAAEMMRGTRAVYDLVLLISLSIAYVNSFPLQVLPSIPGYIPVYIRHGDQPLEEINPALAEAFHEGSSLSKNLNLDNISNSTDINPEEDGANAYNVYSVQVRQVNNNVGTRDEEKNPIEEAVEIKASVPNTNKESRREKHRRKIIPIPVIKVNPLTQEEKEVLEKFQIEVGEEIKSSNNMHDSSSDLSEPPSVKSHRKNNEKTFDPVIKVDRVITDESAESDSHLTKDLSQLSTDENAPMSLINEEIPRKELPLPNILSNVKKVFVSPETLMKLEKERTESRKFEEKSK